MKFLCAIFLIPFLLTESLSANSSDISPGAFVVIEDVTQAKPDARDFFIKAFLSGQFVEVQRDGNRAMVTVQPNWPGYSNGEKFHLNDWDIAKGWIHFTERQRALDNVLRSGELLTDLFIAFPNDPILQSTIESISKSPPKAATRDVETMKEQLTGLLKEKASGLPLGTWKAYPDFKAFYDANHLENLMKLYGQKLRVSPEGEPMLLYQGEWHPWQEIASVVPVDKEGVMQGYVYTLNGFEAGTLDGAIRLIQKGGQPVYGNRHVIEVNELYEKTFHGSLFKGQLWLHLYFPNGDAYSVGWTKSTPFELSIWERMDPYYQGPYYRGKVVSPALEELETEANTLKVPIEISEGQMAKVLKFLHEYQQSPDAVGVDRPLGTKSHGQFAYVTLVQAGIDPSLFGKYGGSNPVINWAWMDNIQKWRDEQLNALKTRRVTETEKDRIRFGLPSEPLKLDWRGNYVPAT